MAIPRAKSQLDNEHPQKVLIAGCCYAGLAAALNLLDLCEGRSARFDLGSELPPIKLCIEITIVDERDGYYHIIGSPLALANEDYASKAWIKFSELPALQHPAIKFMHGSLSKVDIESKRATIVPHGSSRAVPHKYDYLIAATGLRRRWPVVPQSLTKDDYIHEVRTHINAVRTVKKGITVVGGGAVGIEMAAELKLVQPNTQIALIHSRDRLMSSEPLPDDFKDEALALLRKENIEVVIGKRVLSQTRAADGLTTTLCLSDDTSISTSIVINAISRPIPTSSYLPSKVLDVEGFVKVKPSLHFYGDYHFAAGDIALWSGIKRCGGAMFMGFHCAYNIHQHLLWRQRHLTSSITDDMHALSDDTQTADELRPKYKELEAFPPVIGLAIGHTAAVYSPTEGTKSGPDMLKYMFGDDLGFSMCYAYLKLGERLLSATKSSLDIAAECTTEGNSTEVVGEPGTPSLPIASLQSGGRDKIYSESNNTSALDREKVFAVAKVAL